MKHARTDYDQRIQDSAGIIPADEPVFLLRAQDKIAAAVVDDYANRLAAVGGDPEVVRRARAHALAMKRWPTKKFPDVPENV